MPTIAFHETGIGGLLRVEPSTSTDLRGSFTKTFVAERFAEAGLAASFAEEYQTLSPRGVLRGMHFQRPPHDLHKLVYCVSGKVLDVVVDLRVGSPTFRRAESFELEGPGGAGLYIPAGCAHGFYVLEDHALMTYAVTSAYAPESDAGVLWSSVPATWPVTDVVLSDRDASWPSLEDFDSPFTYRAGE